MMISMLEVINDQGSCYWKNGSKNTNLTTNADSMSWGIGIDSDNNIYNAGYYMKSHSLNSFLFGKIIKGQT